MTRTWIHRTLALALLCLAAGLPLLSGLRSGAAAEPAPTREAIDAAVRHAVKWLKKRQRRDGSFGPCRSGAVLYDGSPNMDPVCYETGPTTLALFTLSRCGVRKEDDVIQQGLAWIRKHLKDAIRKEKSPKGHVYTSYESASAILMLTAVHDTRLAVTPSSSPGTAPRNSPFRETKKDWMLLHACVQHLVGGAGKRGCQQRDGSFGYRRKDKEGDVSATQFALLALRAAVRAGYPLRRVAPNVWVNAAKYLLKVQIEEGMFPYRAGEAWSAGMSAAGVASLLICREQLAREKQKAPAGLDEAIKKGLDALSRAYDPSTNVAGDKRAGIFYHYCYLYAVERVGALAPGAKLGEEDWYTAGARWLLNQQIEDGQWEDDSSMGPKETLGTCFALLFLRRATPPVITGAAQPK